MEHIIIIFSTAGKQKKNDAKVGNKEEEMERYRRKEERKKEREDGQGRETGKEIKRKEEME